MANKWKENGGIRYRYNEDTGEVLARAQPVYACAAESVEANCPHEVHFDAPYLEQQGVLAQNATKRYIDRASAMRAVEEVYP